MGSGDSGTPARYLNNFLRNVVKINLESVKCLRLEIMSEFQYNISSSIFNLTNRNRWAIFLNI